MPNIHQVRRVLLKAPAVVASGVTIALDGVGSFNEQGSGANITSTLTTTGGSGVAVFFSVTNATSGNSNVTSPNLTWTKQTAINDGSNNVIDYWTAPYSSNLSSEVITAATEFGLPASAVSFGISGVRTAGPYDTGTRPTTSITSSNAAITIANSPDFVFGLLAGTNVTLPSGAGSGWTVAGSGPFGSSVSYRLLVLYQVASSTGAYTPTQGSGTTTMSVTDAIRQGP